MKHRLLFQCDYATFFMDHYKALPKIISYSFDTVLEIDGRLA